jgi:hypothetical protein
VEEDAVEGGRNLVMRKKILKPEEDAEESV